MPALVAIGLPFQPTSFVGRGRELTEIGRLLANLAYRLLTLLGLGRIGKTRLASEVAVAHTADFADGVAFVQLASVQAPHQTAAPLSAILNLSFTGQSDPTTHLLGSQGSAAGSGRVGVTLYTS